MIGLTRIVKSIAGRLTGASYQCPICGSASPKMKIAKPFGAFVKDGPTVAKMTCQKCGHKWSVPLRVGP